MAGLRTCGSITGVRFTRPTTAEAVESPIELRGARHLWTDPATSGGYRLQLVQPPELTCDHGDAGSRALMALS